MILFSDSAKRAKLEEAIRYGYIARQTDSDGVEHYILTPRGQQKWMLEKMGIGR